MKINNIKNVLTRKMGRAGLKLKKHSPEILMAAGIVGTITGTVMACKATLKVNDILEEHENEMAKIQKVIDMDLEYSEEDKKKDTTIIYTKTAVSFAKNYAPAVIVSGLSLTCILASNNILRKRNVALAAAYAGIDKAFKDYRSRVVERFGEKLDHELRYNIKAVEVEETVIDENGEEKTVVNTVEVADPNSFSPYCIIYDDGCNGWSKDPEENKFFLLQQQNYANEKLKSQGYLFLNDIYKALGAPVTKAGQSVGWIYDEKNPIGDNYIDFGILDVNSPKARDFVNGYERNIVLDFNVDGDILDKI